MQLKEKRDAAILEKLKEGMSAYAIAKMFKMGESTVKDVRKQYAENPESGNPAYPPSSTSAIPMASTEDRSETREDARS
ncbi:helix-turn-helix domain-containing protein [Aeromonas caviae]